MHLRGALSSLLVLAASAQAEPALVFSANDQRSGYSPDGMFVVPQPGPGSLTALDFSSFPPKSTSIDPVPCSVIGPPTCVAATPDGSIILLAAAMQVNADKPNELTPDRKLTLLTWRNNTLEMLDQIDVGQQPSGIALAREGETAFVTLRAEGKIAVLDLAGRKLAIKKTVSVARPEDSLAQLAFSPDGQTGLATLHEKNVVLVLDRDLKVQQELSLGKGPYDINFLPDGQRALVACTKDDALYWLIREGDTWKVGDRIPVGRVPEGLDVSSDGKWIAASCFEGANSKNKEANPARVHILSIGKDYQITPRQKLIVKGIPQSAVFTPDCRHLVAGQFGEKTLVIYKLEGETWMDTGQTMETPGQPAALTVGGSNCFPKTL